VASTCHCSQSVCSTADANDSESGEDAFTLNPFAAAAKNAPMTTGTCSAYTKDIGVSRPDGAQSHDWGVDLTINPRYHATPALGSAYGATVALKSGGTERKLTGGGAAGPRLTFGVIPNTSDSPQTYRISFTDLLRAGPTDRTRPASRTSVSRSDVSGSPTARRVSAPAGISSRAASPTRCA
jgi:hypothetical protein